MDREFVPNVLNCVNRARYGPSCHGACGSPARGGLLTLRFAFCGEGSPTFVGAGLMREIGATRGRSRDRTTHRRDAATAGGKTLAAGFAKTLRGVFHNGDSFRLVRRRTRGGITLAPTGRFRNRGDASCVHGEVTRSGETAAKIAPREDRLGWSGFRKTPAGWFDVAAGLRACRVFDPDPHPKCSIRQAQRPAATAES